MIECQRCHKLFEPTKGHEIDQKYCKPCKPIATKEVNKITKRKRREAEKLNAPIIIPPDYVDDGEITDFMRERMDMLTHEFRPLRGSWLQI